MSDKTVRWDDIKRKIWLKQTFERVKMKLKDTFEFVKGILTGAILWCKNHPVKAASIASSAAYVVGKFAKIYVTHAESVRRDRDFYDPRTGRHTKARRNVKPWESAEIDRRYNQGEPYSQILRDLGLAR